MKKQLNTEDDRKAHIKEIRDRLFPDCENKIFKKKGRGPFGAIPVVFRKLLWCLTLQELRLLLYLHLRKDEHEICYPNMEEILFDLNLKHKKKITLVLNHLEKKKFIERAKEGARTYYLLLDPRIAIEEMKKNLPDDKLTDINELYYQIKQTPISRGSNP